MADTAYGAPQADSGGGIGGYIQDNPWLKWVALGGVAVVVYLVFRRRQGAAQATLGDASQTSSYTGGVDPNTGLPYQSYAVNPLTGLPINPSTGLDFGQIGSPATDIGAWITAALKALGTTVDPLAAENAFYRFTNGLSLTAEQQAIISQAIAKVGNPPGGPYPVVSTSSGSAGTAAWTAGPIFNPIGFHFATNFPETVIGGTGNLVALGKLGLSTIKGVISGAPLYYKHNVKGRTVWSRISSLAQYLNLPKGTVIATLRGEQYVAPAAA